MRNFILAISLLFIYSVTCNAQTIVEKNTYTFDVGSYIKKTNLKIREGDEVHISASGTIVLRGVTGTTGPNGIDGFTNCCMDAVFPYGALLYKIGDDDWNIVDPSDTITAERMGYLKFMVNDNDPSNNSGRFIVTVRVKSLGADNAPKIAKRIEKDIEPKEMPAKTSPHSPPGILTLSELQKASNYNLNDAKVFLTSKQFRLDQSSSNASKYSYNKGNVSASLIKDVKENQTTLQTSSMDNYEEIKSSLDQYGYTRRKLVKKVDGVTKYANSNFSLIILSFKLNNKYQYSFAIKKL